MGQSTAPTGAAATPATAPAAVRPIYPPRRLAPHVFRRVDPYLDELQTDFVRNINEIVTVHGKEANFDWAENVSFRPSVWYLSLELKPMRTMDIDLPGPDGRLRRQTVWYLIYKVKNPAMVYQQVPVAHNAQTQQVMRKVQGVGKHPSPVERQFYEIKQNPKVPIRFVPNFELVTLDATRTDPQSGQVTAASMRYMDRYMPLAAKAIAMREDPGQKILDCVQMTVREIQPGEEVWGVALWCGVNPTTDKFSIYVNGLTNAMKWTGDKEFKYKTLKLNYWRPGDETSSGQRSKVFRMGIPGVDGGLDYLWLFR